MSIESLLTPCAVASTIIWGAFVIWFTTRARWWKNPLGWNTFGVSFILFAVLLRASITRVYPDLELSEVFGVLVYFAASVLGVQRLIEMERAQSEMVHFNDVK